MAAQEALDLLAAFYVAEVKSRNGVTQFDENTTQALTKLAEFITQQVPKFGIMLCGTCGNGKTTMMKAFQSCVHYLDSLHHFEFLDDKEYGRRFKPGMRILDVRDILYAAKDWEQFKTMRDYTMVGIDDLGKEQGEILDYGNVLTPVIEFLEYRYDKQLFTFITSNLTGPEIRKKYQDRIADRFNEMLHVITFKDITYRPR